jgi:hypothetical protein
MKTRNFILTLVGFFLCGNNIAQIYESGKLYVRINTIDAVPIISGIGTNKTITFNQSSLDDIFSSYNLQDFTRAFIQTENEDLNNT